MSQGAQGPGRNGYSSTYVSFSTWNHNRELNYANSVQGLLGTRDLSDVLMNTCHGNT